MTIIKQYNSGTAQWEAIAVGQVGATGPGVAAGGTTDQILTKVSNTDFDTQWVSTIDASVLYDNTNSTLSATLLQTAIDELDAKKLDVSALTSSVTFFPTDAASDIGGYGKLVTSTSDPDYDTVAVNVNTGAFSGTDNLVGSLASAAGVLEGNTTPINVTTVGQVRRVTGNANDGASFYFEVYKRDSLGAETLIGTSDNTSAVSNTSYEEFSASALISDTTFTDTDRVVLKFYADVVAGNGGVTYDFQYGGNTPVRTLFPVPVSVIPRLTDAEDIIVDASGFSGLLSGTDDDVQQALSTLDSVTKTDIGLGNVTDDAQLKIASNLSDLNDAATARTNLGLGNVDNVSAADLRDRSTHTGTQTLSTISDAGTIASQDANSVNIDGGNIDGTPIGANSADEGNFTTLDASGDVNFDSGTLFVDASADRVGVGTTSPAFKLQVNDSSAATGNVSIANLGTASGTRAIGLAFTNWDVAGASAYTSGYIRSLKSSGTNSGNLEFYTKPNGGTLTEAMRIDSSGNVGIGTTDTQIYTKSGSGNDGVVLRGSVGIVGATRNSFQCAIFNRTSTDGPILELRKDGVQVGTLDGRGGGMAFSVGGERMRIDSSGNARVGNSLSSTVWPSAASSSGVNEARLGFDGSISSTTNAATTMYLNRNASDGDLIRFYSQGAQEGSISVSGTTVSYNGGHLSRWSRLPSGEQDDSILKGTVMTNLDAMVEWGDEDNEQLNQMAVSSVEGDPNVSGVFVNWDNDDDWNDMNVAMTGDMIIRIGAGVTVQRGDLLISAGDGTAKPQSDDVVKSKTIAKVTSTHVTCTYDDGSYCVPCVLMAC